MINVKGAKKQVVGNDPADRFKLKIEPKKSRMPYALGAALAALALYLKSSLAAGASEVPAAPENGAKALGEQASKLRAEDKGHQPGQRSDDDKQAEKFGPSGDNRAFAADAPPARVHTSASVDMNVGLTIASARSTVANINVHRQHKPGMIDMQSLFGNAGDFSEAWVNEGGGASAAGPRPSASDRNRAPRSNRPTTLFDVTSGAAVAIAISDLLANVSDADGDALMVGNVTVSSGAIMAVEGGFIYQASTDAPGPVVLTYQVSDGKAVTTLTANFAVVPNTIDGTDLGDTLAGTAASDAITGRNGNDIISALQGSDLIDGGAGNDGISGGSGDDTISGGAGNDTIFGGSGNDRLSGGEGNDRLRGEDGNDLLMGEAGNDLLMGDAGNDTLSDGAGADTVLGDVGNDVVIAASDAADDVYDGGAGDDTLDYSAATAGVEIDLLGNLATGIDIGSDEISGFEVIKGGSGDDYIIVGDDEVILIGGGGANVFEFVDSVLSNGSAITAHQILDFGVGDLIKTSIFDIFKKPEDAAQALYDALQGGDASSTGASLIRIRYEANEDREDTIVEWDTEVAGQITVVTLNGHHTLMWTDQG